MHHLTTDSYTLDLYSWIGLIGMILIVAAYYLNQVAYLTTKNIKYSLINLVGAILLLISLYFHFNLGSFLIECFWVIISIIGLVRCYRQQPPYDPSKHSDVEPPNQ